MKLGGQRGPPHVAHVAAGGEGRQQLLDRHPLDGRLASGVDVGQQHDVGAAQRGREERQQVARPGVAMRLEGDDQTPPVKAGRRHGGRQLGRVVAIVVDNQDAADLAAHREPPIDALKALEGGAVVLK